MCMRIARVARGVVFVIGHDSGPRLVVAVARFSDPAQRVGARRVRGSPRCTNTWCKRFQRVPIWRELTSAGQRLCDDELIVRALISQSGAHYLFGEPGAAMRAAQDAIDLAFTRFTAGHSLRVKALCAALNISEESGQLIEQLQVEREQVADTHLQAAADWVLGNDAFHKGDISQGVEFHNNTLKALSPAADFRNWARFLRATITERLNAGTDLGVDDSCHKRKPLFKSWEALMKFPS